MARRRKGECEDSYACVALWLCRLWLRLRLRFRLNCLRSAPSSVSLRRYMKGWITAVPNGSLVLLDLMAEESPLWKRTQSYYGAPFIWCSE